MLAESSQYELESRYTEILCCKQTHIETFVAYWRFVVKKKSALQSRDTDVESSILVTLKAWLTKIWNTQGLVHKQHFVASFGVLLNLLKSAIHKLHLCTNLHSYVCLLCFGIHKLPFCSNLHFCSKSRTTHGQPPVLHTPLFSVRECCSSSGWLWVVCHLLPLGDLRIEVQLYVEEHKKMWTSRRSHPCSWSWSQIQSWGCSPDLSHMHSKSSRKSKSSQKKAMRDLTPSRHSDSEEMAQGRQDASFAPLMPLVTE